MSTSKFASPLLLLPFAMTGCADFGAGPGEPPLEEEIIFAEELEETDLPDDELMRMAEDESYATYDHCQYVNLVPNTMTLADATPWSLSIRVDATDSYRRDCVAWWRVYDRDSGEPVLDWQSSPLPHTFAHTGLRPGTQYCYRALTYSQKGYAERSYNCFETESNPVVAQPGLAFPINELRTPVH